MNAADFPINSKLDPHHFRIAIFGSARIKPEDQIYKDTFELARAIAKHKMDVVTGGGPGLMEAANYGHRMGSDPEFKSIGLTIELPNEQGGNKHLDIKQHFQRFAERLETFLNISNVVVVMPGGIGTALELFYSWQLVQVGKVGRIPIILHSESWHKIRDWVRDNLLAEGLISPEDMNYVYCVQNNEEAMELIEEFHKQFKKHGEGHFLDSQKYTV
jgi:uncharacterized protein (TIGR00730 family)